MITDNIEGLFALSSISSQDCLQWNIESLTQTWCIHNLSEYICLQKPTSLTIRPAAAVKFYWTTKCRWTSRWVRTLNATHREAVRGSSAQAETVDSPLTGGPSLTSTPLSSRWLLFHDLGLLERITKGDENTGLPVQL